MNCFVLFSFTVGFFYCTLSFMFSNVLWIDSIFYVGDGLLVFIRILLCCLEFLSVYVRCVSLFLRLFCNLLSVHILGVLLSVMCYFCLLFVFYFCFSIVFFVLFLCFIWLLDVCSAGIQVFIYTMLLSVFSQDWVV